MKPLSVPDGDVRERAHSGEEYDQPRCCYVSRHDRETVTVRAVWSADCETLQLEAVLRDDFQKLVSHFEDADVHSDYAASSIQNESAHNRTRSAGIKEWFPSATDVILVEASIHYLHNTRVCVEDESFSCPRGRQGGAPESTDTIHTE